jgi:hypothetical protein
MARSRSRFARTVSTSSRTNAEVLDLIERAFGDAPRPEDSELLHPRSMDDHDIEQLYGIRHWRDVPEAVVEHEYAALFFLGPAGFRHFLAAYMSYALRHPITDQMAVESTIFALRPASDDLREFTLSKFTLFDAPQRAAVLAFLEAMAKLDDFSDPTLAEALAYWRSVSV